MEIGCGTGFILLILFLLYRAMQDFGDTIAIVFILILVISFLAMLFGFGE